MTDSDHYAGGAFVNKLAFNGLREVGQGNIAHIGISAQYQHVMYGDSKMQCFQVIFYAFNFYAFAFIR